MEKNTYRTKRTKTKSELAQILSHQFTKQAGDSDHHFQLSERIGKGSIRRMKLKEGMEIIISDIELYENLTVLVQKSSDFFEMNYCITGEAMFKMNNQRLKIQEPVSQVYYCNDYDGKLELQANRRNNIVEIRIAPAALLHYFDNERDKIIINKMLANQTGKLTTYPLTPMIKKRLYEIDQCSFHGAMKKMYIESKVMELITLFFQEDSFCYTCSDSLLQPEEIKRLNRAREIILTSLDDPYSIKELAKKVGLNEFKLKKGFKQLYGTTIFGLVRSQRMEKAAWLMKKKGYNVSETATLLGYSNFSNFTIAFHKYFGCNPGEYLKYLNERIH